MFCALFERIESWHLFSSMFHLFDVIFFLVTLLQLAKHFHSSKKVALVRLEEDLSSPLKAFPLPLMSDMKLS